MHATSQLTLTLAGRTVECLIRRSRRSRRIRLTVRYDDTLLVTMPHNARFKDAERLIEQHRDWIVTRLRALQRQRRLSAPFEVEDGATLPTPYNKYTLKLFVNSNEKAHWECEDSTVSLYLPHSSRDWIANGIINWYRHIALQIILKRTLYWSQMMDITPRQVRVKNQRTLWGSCSRIGNLNFNWRTMLLSPEALDYLIIHELAHLKEMNHSPHFWKIVQQYCPDFRDCKKELRRKNHWLGFPANII